jgi:hypothetical protein
MARQSRMRLDKKRLDSRLISQSKSFGCVVSWLAAGSIAAALIGCVPLETTQTSDSSTQVYGPFPTYGTSTHSESSYSGIAPAYGPYPYDSYPPGTYPPGAYPVGPTTIYSCNAGYCSSYTTEHYGYSSVPPYPYPPGYPVYPPVIIVNPPPHQQPPPPPKSGVFVPGAGKPVPNSGYSASGNSNTNGAWRRPAPVQGPVPMKMDGGSAAASSSSAGSAGITTSTRPVTSYEPVPTRGYTPPAPAVNSITSTNQYRAAPPAPVRSFEGTSSFTRSAPQPVSPPPAPLNNSSNNAPANGRAGMPFRRPQ